MARSITTIQQQILDNIAADTTLGPLLTSTSKRAIYRLLAFIVATAINLLEQLIDIFTLNVQNIAASAAPASPAWLQAQIFKFQYSAVNTQTIQLINLAPTYPVIDTTLQIITRCSVTTNLANAVIIKVAKQTPPVALLAAELTALQSYINQIGVAGITYTVTSSNPDQLYIQAQVFYNGQYSNVIQANVITAINNFLGALPFNGQMRISSLEIAIRNVPGVTDIIFQNVAARADAVAFGSGTSLILNNSVISRLWPTVAGYMIGEATAGQTLSNTLTFIPD